MVNALLTQIDRLKHQKNVLIMSNQQPSGKRSVRFLLLYHAASQHILVKDSAFVDRADITEYIGLPTTHGCIRDSTKHIDRAHEKGIVISAVRYHSSLSPSVYNLNSRYLGCPARRRCGDIFQNAQSRQERRDVKFPAFANTSFDFNLLIKRTCVKG